ncbi:unnamed protein product [Urochloa humidicola]
MAGSFSRALWPRSTNRSTPGSGRQRRSVHERLGALPSWTDGLETAAPFPVSGPALHHPAMDAGGTPVVRFATPIFRYPASAAHIHRAWRAATPFPAAHAPATPPLHAAAADDIAEVHMSSVDMAPSRRLAYAFIEPACADPGRFIRSALEQCAGDPPVRLAPSSHGAMMLVFGHQHFRETVIRGGPIDLDGSRLTLVRHEEADFRIVCLYTRLVELAATNFPPEHWHEGGIREAFQVYGQVCCVAKSCLREVDGQRRDFGVADYSVVRVLVLVDEHKVIKTGLPVRNPRGEIAGIARVRVVGEWAHPPGSPPPDSHTFSDDSGDGPPRADFTTPRRGRLGMFQSPWSRTLFQGSSSAGGVEPRGTCRTLGSALYPSVPLWTFVSSACTALARALSLSGVPGIVVRDLPTPERPRTPPPQAAPAVTLSDSDEIAPARRLPQSVLPSLSDLLDKEEHEVSLRKKRARRKRASDSASKIRRSRRLAAKEVPFYEDATSKAARVQEAKLDLAKASARMKKAVEDSGILARPAPKRIAPKKLRCLGRACGLAHLSEVEDEVPAPA